MKDEDMQSIKSAGQTQGKAKAKGKGKSKEANRFEEQDKADKGKAVVAAGTKRKLEDVEKASGDETKEPEKNDEKRNVSAAVPGQKKRLIKNVSHRESNASDTSSGDSDQSAKGSSKTQDKHREQQPRKKKKMATIMGSPSGANAKDLEKSNFSSDNPFQSGSRQGTPDRRKRKSSATAAAQAKSPVTPMSALRKSQVSDVSFRVALPKTASSKRADEDNDIEMQEQSQAEPETETETVPIAAEPIPAESPKQETRGRPPKFDLKSDLASASASAAAATQSPQRFSMTPDGFLQQLAASQSGNQQRLEQLFPAPQSPQHTQQAPMSGSSKTSSKRQASASMLPPVAPNIPALAQGNDAEEIQTLQRRRIATLRQHVESAGAGDREHRSHSRRSSIASIADSVGEARGIPAVPAAAAAAAKATEAEEAEAGEERQVTGDSFQRRRKAGSSSFMRKLALFALLGLGAVGWRTHEQFRMGFGNTRAENAHLGPPAASPLVEPAAIDFANAPLTERVRYLVQMARARYVQPRPLDCPEHATCLAYASIPPESATQEAMLENGSPRDQWLVNVDGQSKRVV
ncbi:hypothetical protein J3B02_004861, partial [Coemansia erecta]